MRMFNPNHGRFAESVQNSSNFGADQVRQTYSFQICICQSQIFVKVNKITTNMRSQCCLLSRPSVQLQYIVILPI